MYADRVTDGIRVSLQETNRRREIQRRYNEERGITPESIRKSVTDLLSSVYEADYYTVPIVSDKEEVFLSEKDLLTMIRKLRSDMKRAAENLEFEQAARIRDRLRELKELGLELG